MSRRRRSAGRAALAVILGGALTGGSDPRAVACEPSEPSCPFLTDEEEDAQQIGVPMAFAIAGGVFTLAFGIPATSGAPSSFVLDQQRTWGIANVTMGAINVIAASMILTVGETRTARAIGITALVVGVPDLAVGSTLLALSERPMPGVTIRPFIFRDDDYALGFGLAATLTGL